MVTHKLVKKLANNENYNECVYEYINQSTLIMVGLFILSSLERDAVCPVSNLSFLFS